MQDRETMIPLAEARRHWPGTPHASTLWRACRYGVRASNGQRVYLEHERYGRRIYTSRASIERFGRRLAEADAAHFGRPPVEAGGTLEGPRQTGAKRATVVSLSTDEQ